MQVLLQGWFGLLVSVLTKPQGNEKSKHISWLTTDWSYVIERKKNLTPLHKLNYIVPALITERRKIFLDEFSACEEDCFMFVLVIFADEPPQFDMKEAPYWCI